jgi:hypothetical protein
MQRLLIEGWRGINHSFAMVNQHQILALGRCSSLQLHHKDMPFFMPNWNAKSNDAGFPPAIFESASVIFLVTKFSPLFGDS